ncbi:MAG: hypothetical protein ACI4PR_01700 [Acutalibacteraceae bacterium]
MKKLLKKTIKAPMFLVFSIILVLSTISACMFYINAQETLTNEHRVTLPEHPGAIKTLQYSIWKPNENGSPTWTNWEDTSGKEQLTISNGGKIRFLIKFKENYCNLPLSRIVIKSDATGESITKYNFKKVIAINDNNTIETGSDDGTEMVNSENSYISEDIEINQDQILHFEGTDQNKHSLTLTAPKNYEEIFDIYYSISTQEETTSTGVENSVSLQSFVTEDSFELKKIYPTSTADAENIEYKLEDIPYCSYVNLEAKLKSKYSNLFTDGGEGGKLLFKYNDMVWESTKGDDNTYKYSLEILEDTERTLVFNPYDSISPNKYTITNGTGTILSYKKENDANNSGNLNPGDNLTNVAHGETYIFYIDNDFTLVYDGTKLMDKITENGKTAYILPDVTSNCTISIEKSRETQLGTYFIKFPEIERIQFINPLDGMALSEKEYTDAGSTFKFKIKESEGYSADNLTINYKTTGLTESRTLIPTDGIYSIENISGNTEIIVTGTPELKTYKMKIPKNPRKYLETTIQNNGENLEPETTDENDFYDIYDITYGDDITIDFKSTIEKLNLTDLEISNEYGTPEIKNNYSSKKESSWSVRVTGNILVQISDLKPESVVFTFNNNEGDTRISFGKNENGMITGSYYELDNNEIPIQKDDYFENQFSVPYGSNVYLKIISTESNLEIYKSLSTDSIGDIITPDENGYYVMNQVTNDIFLEERSILSKEFTISLNSYKKGDNGTDGNPSLVKISTNGNNYRTYDDLSEDERKNFATVPFGKSFKLYLETTDSGIVNVIKNSDSNLNIIKNPTYEDYNTLDSSTYKYSDNVYCGNFDDNGKTFKIQTEEGTEKKYIEIPVVNSDDVLTFYNIKEYTTNKITARNMASKYTLVGASEEDEDYKISFQESPTDMEENLGIKIPAGSKEYDMAYHIIDYNDPGDTERYNACIKAQEGENLAGCDTGTRRFEAPKKLKINLEYGDKCTKKNFIGFQFDGVRYDTVKGSCGEYGDPTGGTQIIFDSTANPHPIVTDMFGLKKQFIEDSQKNPNDPYNYMYANTKADKGCSPTDSLRGLFQIHYLLDTTFIAKYLKNNTPNKYYGHYSTFNTKYFSYNYNETSGIQFYSLLMKIDDLNYIAKDRKAYKYYHWNPDTNYENREVDPSKEYILFYRNKYCPDETGGQIPFREYYRKNVDDKNISEEELEASGYFTDNDEIYIKGKNPKEIILKDGTKKSEIDLNIEAKTLYVYTNNPDSRYEDDILLKGDEITKDLAGANPQNVRIYSHKEMNYGYENRCVFNPWEDRITDDNQPTMLNFSTKSRVYGDEYDGNSNKIFNVRAMNFFKEIRIKPIFSNVTYSDSIEGEYSQSPTIKLPSYPIEGAKLYKPETTSDSSIDIGNEITTETIQYNESDPCWSKTEIDGQSYPVFKFIIKPEEGYNFIPGSVKCYPEGYSTLSYEKKTNIDSETYYIYTIQKIKETNLTITVPEIQKYKYTVSCNNGYTDFYDNSTGEQFLKKELEIGSTFTFRTEEQKGYQSDETLIINVGNDTFKVTSGGEDSTAVLPNGTIVSFLKKDSSLKNLYTISNVQESFSIFSTRLRENIPITLTYDEGFYYKDVDGKYITMKKSENGQEEVYYTDDPSEVSEKNIELSVDYGSNFYFTIEERDGFDPLSTILTANNIRLDQENGKYLVQNVTSETTIKAESIEKIKYNVYFTNHEGATFKSSDGKDLIGANTVTYGDDLIFKINISDAYSNSENYKVMVEYSTEGKKSTEIPKVKNEDGNDTDKYIIKDIQEDLRVYVENLEHNKYSMKLYNSDGIVYYDKYGQEKYPSGGQFVEKAIYHGENFSFKIVAEEGYDISDIKVYSAQEKTNVRKQLLPSNDIYTIEQPTNNCIITVENTKKSTYNVEIRSTTGASCLDANGKTLESNLTVNHGENLEFTIALDNAYNRSTPIVTLKGSLNIISPVDGKYTIANITENTIIEITGVKKNTYKATFKETEGVIYKNGKNKPFSGSLDAEDGETLNFKITLMDAYDKSSPIVLLNNSKPIAESAGVYSINDVNSDLEISVENVFKNPEEITMEDVNNVPDKVSTELDISRVVTATNTYLSLSDEEKAQVTNLAELKRAQEEAGVINHKSGDISVTGLDWNIKVMVEKLTENKEKINYLNEKIDRREVIYLYDIYLVDLLTNEVYELPYGNKVTVTMPAPELNGYKNETVVHEKSSGNIEYLDLNITDNTARFEATSFSLFGIAAKKIPNYSENPSATKISVSDLVDNEEELQALLGEGITSQLGDLTKDISDTDLFGDDTSSSSKKEINSWYQWILDHELLSVIIILIIGSLIIFLILLKAKKEKS